MINKCQYSQISITSTGDRRVNCSALFATSTQRVRPDIIECNKYLPAGTPSQFDMEKQAWIIETKNGRVVGFKAPKQEKDTMYDD